MAQRTITHDSECATVAEAATVLNMTVSALRERLREWEAADALPFPILRLGPRQTRVPWRPLLAFARGEAESK